MTKISQYKVTHEDDKDIYFIKDSRDRYYTVTVNINNIFDYTVKLDDYTIYTDEFKQKYNETTDEEKVYTNIELFIKMINNKDYSMAYSHINDEFKNNNFGDVNKFISYITDRFYDFNTIESVSNSNKDGKYYICQITLKNGANNSSEEKEETFIIKLDEDTNFEISFSL